MQKKERKLLPLGIQTFADIRNPKRNYAYVDKTAMAYQMISGGTKYCFLSRPRRFGKSLFLDTLAEIFKGSKKTFEGLYIYDKWDWNTKYSVLKISLGGGGISNKEVLIRNLLYIISDNAQKLEVELNSDIQDINLLFRDLIVKTHKKYNQQVVILVDEYDKPLLDNIGNDEHIEEIRRTIRSFYAEIKNNDAYIRFGFITGISRFSQMSFFSDLNNLTDISLDPRYSTVTGYTQNDLEEVFAEFLDGVDLEEVRKWYNGYNFLGEPLYNPYDILNFFDKQNVFKNYWWQTGQQSFLIKMMKGKNYHLPNLENITVGEAILEKFNIEDINIVALLWQSGYLTFDTVKQNPMNKKTTYKLKVPNLEVQESLNLLFFNYLSSESFTDIIVQNSMLESLYEHNFKKVEELLKTLFSSIPYDNHSGNTMSNYEGYYASVIYAYLAALGVPLLSEDHSNLGRADMTMFFPNSIIIIEFKVDKNENAIEQIKRKKYYEKYLSDGRDIYLVGIKFSSEEKNITSFVYEKYG